MDKNQNAMEQAMALANSSAGKQLLKMLRQSSGADLENIKAAAAAGDYALLQRSLSGFLENPEVQRLMQQMGGSHGTNGR